MYTDLFFSYLLAQEQNRGKQRVFCFKETMTVTFKFSNLNVKGDIA